MICHQFLDYKFYKMDDQWYFGSYFYDGLRKRLVAFDESSNKIWSLLLHAWAHGLWESGWVNLNNCTHAQINQKIKWMK